MVADLGKMLNAPTGLIEQKDSTLYRDSVEITSYRITLRSCDRER